MRKHFPVIDTVYGDYVVISLNTAKKDNRICFEVRCKCGVIEFKLAKDLKSGRCTSCKSCSSKKTAVKTPPPVNFKGMGDLGSTYFSKLKSGAILRNLEFLITLEYAWNLLVEQDFKCKLSGLPINLTKLTKKSNPDYANFTASLDRIDSKKGYIEDNVQWVHKTINGMKLNMTDEDFIFFCKSVSNHN